MMFSGTDEVCFEEFIADFRQTARSNEWWESDYALILGGYLNGAASHYYKYTYNYDMDFATISKLLREEFPCGCFNCKERAATATLVAFNTEDKTADLIGEGGPSNILNKDDNAVLYSSMMMDEPHTDEQNDDHDDQSDEIDDQSCNESSLVDDEMRLECTDEAKNPGVSIPIICSPNLFPGNQDSFFLESQCDQDEQTNKDHIDNDHDLEINYEINNNETGQSFFQSEVEDMVPSSRDEVHSLLVTTKSNNFNFEFIFYNKYRCHATCQPEKGLAPRKFVHAKLNHRPQIKKKKCVVKRSLIRRKSIR